MKLGESACYGQRELSARAEPGMAGKRPMHVQPSAPLETETTTETTTETDSAKLDDDGDVVNNCNDKCPNSTAGQTIGPDGCPVPVTIDLRGVNFDFDKDAVRPDAVAILTDMVDIVSSLGTAVARVGLQPGPDGLGQVVAGPGPPNLRGLVETRRFRRKAPTGRASPTLGRRARLGSTRSRSRRRQPASSRSTSRHDRQ